MTITPTDIGKASQERYLTYALSVVSSRALPDIRDGLKPVQRRILFAMYKNLSLLPDASPRKSAAIVGDVIGKFHPHGDAACYEAMVRMAQDFSLRYPLVDGHGNFGSLDGDSAAAYRYTEARLTPLALEILGEIEERTVDTRFNFDSTTEEPVVLPSKLPHLLLNGAAGIAVGMATSIPPHNLRDVMDATVELLDDPAIADTRLATVIKGPDFPTGCQILNSKKELNEIYRTGKGAILMRGGYELEDGTRGKRFLILTSIPYGVNKASLVEKIADLIIARKIPQLVDIRDESTKDIRVVLELAPDADPQLALAYLYRHTQLQETFPVNMTVLVPDEEGVLRPEVVSLTTCLQQFISFREGVIRRRLTFERQRLADRIHILEGIMAIIDKLDEAIKIIRKSSGRTDAAEKLRERFRLTEIQSFAVVDMRVYQLSRTSIEEVEIELKEKRARVKEIDAILESKARIRKIIRTECEELRERLGDKRRSEIIKGAEELEFNAEAYVVEEEVFAIVTADGWLKRIRQGNDPTATRIREGDAILAAHPLTTKDCIAFLTTHGNLFILRVSDVPSSSGYGEPIQKLFKFDDGERIVRSFALPHDGRPVAERLTPQLLVTFVSGQGVGFSTKLADLSVTKRTGRRVVRVRDGDTLAAVAVGDGELLLFSREGYGLVLGREESPERDAPAVGVALLNVKEGDRVIGAVRLEKGDKIKLEVEGGKLRDLDLKEVERGHRALRGKKVGRGPYLRLHIENPTRQLSILK